jgi:uncharacterized membrane protein YfcA
VIGLASIGGVIGGAYLAESLEEHVLRKIFAAWILINAAQLLWRARRS